MEMALDLAFVETLMLAGVRLVAFLVVSPPFNVQQFPGSVKVAMGLGIALAAMPRVTAATDQTPGALLTSSGPGPLLSALVLQAFIGLALGFLVRLVFAAVQTAGSFIDVFGGFQMASAYDPMEGQQSTVFSKFYATTALALLFASDGYQLVIAGIVRSFEVLPLGVAPSLAAMADLMTHGLSQLMVAALQIAGPLIVVLFLADVGLGLLTRVAPALNAFALGFPLKILLTLTLGSVAFLALPHVISSLTEQAVGLIVGGGR
ncbi:flagellar biosynthetic protein FliR [Demequina capsici]|uniref:Flagellar biosynthetic protein FliR n=1 Tax=Demequina capsici TaxID=3075620 RepID=A0AA96JG01_9MICO|nr:MULTISPECIES: flagellar biosynthetic protein FliR [unclassified Demequina]WNM24568.1 flagellar biosynthetic protein FliR [Demequina sp. OYTSA14]WNM27419.1 flagellar biosynthetic protein FliR [Demequina sp. PMTSA13]